MEVCILAKQCHLLPLLSRRSAVIKIIHYLYNLLSIPYRSSARRATYATGSGLRPSGRRAGRMHSGSGTGGHSGHSANSGDSLADDDDDI